MNRDTRGRFTHEQAEAFVRGTLDAIREGKAGKRARVIQALGHAGPPAPSIPGELEMAHHARIRAEKRLRAAQRDLAERRVHYDD